MVHELYEPSTDEVVELHAVLAAIGELRVEDGIF